MPVAHATPNAVNAALTRSPHASEVRSSASPRRRAGTARSAPWPTTSRPSKIGTSASSKGRGAQPSKETTSR